MDKYTDGEAHLLVREREEFARIAHRLSVEGPAFVLLVCAQRLRGVVLAEIRSYEHLAALPAPMPMETPDAVLNELLATPEFRSMALGAGDDPMRALNWHREKLRREGVTFVWLEDVAALERFRTIAPDAYSFRDGLVIVDGVPVFRVEAPTEESAGLRLARRRYQRARSSQEKLEAGGEYVDQLRTGGHIDDALKLALSLRSTLDLCMAATPRRVAPLLRAATQISDAMVTAESMIEPLSIVRRALSFSQGASEPEVQAQSAELLAGLPDPAYAWDGEVIAKARQLVLSLPLQARGTLPGMLRMSASDSSGRGRLREARRFADEAQLRSIGAFNRMLAGLDVASIALDQGRADEALAHLRSAWAEASKSTYLFAVRQLADFHKRHSEIDAALHLLGQLSLRPDGKPNRPILSGDTAIGALSGDYRTVLSTLRQYAAEPPAWRDGFLFRVSNDAVSLLEALHDADRLDPSLLPDWDALLTDAQSRLLAMGDPDPPWYRVLLPALRADLLALRPARHSEAIALFRESWELARLRYPEVAPGVAVRLLDTLLAADALADVPVLLDAAVAVAVARGRLNDQMALLVRRILFGVRTAAEPAAFATLRAQLDALFEESGSLVLQGNTLLSLAQKLPPAPAPGTPDPLALADEARRLFAELTMPHEEMLCVERAGEIVLARGDREGARQRFQQCLRRRRLYGLGMRIPRLERLLAARSDAPATA